MREPLRRGLRSATRLAPRGPQASLATTIVAVRHQRTVAFAGDGQVQLLPQVIDRALPAHRAQ